MTWQQTSVQQAANTLLTWLNSQEGCSYAYLGNQVAAFQFAYNNWRPTIYETPTTVPPPAFSPIGQAYDAPTAAALGYTLGLLPWNVPAPCPPLIPAQAPPGTFTAPAPPPPGPATGPVHVPITVPGPSTGPQAPAPFPFPTFNPSMPTFPSYQPPQGTLPPATQAGPAPTGPILTPPTGPVVTSPTPISTPTPVVTTPTPPSPTTAAATSSSSTGWIIGGGVLAVLTVAGVVYATRKKKR